VFDFFTRAKRKSVWQPGVPGVDLHSHLLPALDDGVQSDEEALSLIRGLMDLGFRRFITTPHIYRGTYDNSPATILPSLEKMNRLLHANRINAEMEAAAEYFFDDYFIRKAEARDLMTFGENYVLFELAFGVKPVMLEQIIFNLMVNGYKPVLAHPERYSYFQDPKLRELDRLKETGICFQLNTLSLAGRYGTRARNTARLLIENGMVEFAGSDLHRELQLPELNEAMSDRYFGRLLSSGRLLNDQL
jgi:tyrosine-protein phosphatase YwqE